MTFWIISFIVLLIVDLFIILIYSRRIIEQVRDSRLQRFETTRKKQYTYMIVWSDDGKIIVIDVTGKRYASYGDQMRNRELTESPPEISYFSQN